MRLVKELEGVAWTLKLNGMHPNVTTRLQKLDKAMLEPDLETLNLCFSREVGYKSVTLTAGFVKLHGRELCPAVWFSVERQL